MFSPNAEFKLLLHPDIGALMPSDVFFETKQYFEKITT